MMIKRWLPNIDKINIQTFIIFFISVEATALHNWGVVSGRARLQQHGEENADDEGTECPSSSLLQQEAVSLTFETFLLNVLTLSG